MADIKGLRREFSPILPENPAGIVRIISLVLSIGLNNKAKPSVLDLVPG